MKTVSVRIEGSEDRDRASEAEGVLLTQSSALSPQHSALNLHHSFLDITTDLLLRGHSVRFKANGWSMRPTIADDEVITVEPVEPSNIKVGDIILYRTERSLIAHRVLQIAKEGSGKIHSSLLCHSFSCVFLKAARLLLKRSTFQSPKVYSCPPHPSSLSPHHLFILRGDASGRCDEPITAGQVLGKVVSVERNGRRIGLHSRKAPISRIARVWASRLKRSILRLPLPLRGL